MIQVDGATLEVLRDVALIIVFGLALLLGAAWWSSRRSR
jgi:hypothetical protein